MATRTKPSLKAAFKQFVVLVTPIPQVRHVVALDEGGGDLFTYIERRDDDVCRLIFAAEKEIRRKFPDEEIDFHIIYLEGRPLRQFVAPLPELVFSRDA